MTSLESLLQINSTWSGWFGAPAPFGRTEFSLTISDVNYVQRTFKGTGIDKRGEFEINGKIFSANSEEEKNHSNEEVLVIFSMEFIKDYKDKSNGTGIHYKGILRRCLLSNPDDKCSREKVCMSGKYTYLYQLGFMKLNICDDFEMVRS